ncbi:hypothetical protein N657DRAFT_563188 [Parathielavia appendiculata]|uniref:F-box domain-containing protein n=1 Tax=Parathielavia appendiculata TaxID=2587402 RepID=A0AAN6UB70_9PEZI|nr:hypothetical protein N657DRAFT_563188 [Parathielavia appendiculata]
MIPGEEICHLGALPPELFEKILMAVDTIRDLASFVATSRFAYWLFQTRKRAVLFKVLQNELGPVLTDARFLFGFPSLNPGARHFYIDWLHTKAATYVSMLRSHGDAEQLARGQGIPSVGELTELCRTLHQVNLLADFYAAALLGHDCPLAWVRGSADPACPARRPLSRTERLRLVRALYRRQIISNAWAPSKRDATRTARPWSRAELAAIGNTSEHQGVRLGLFSAFEPWELQQVDHVNLFITCLCLVLARLAATWSQAHPTVHTILTVRPILPHNYGQMYAHLGILVHYLQANPALADSALDNLRRTLGSQLLWNDSEFRRYELSPLTSLLWQLDRARDFPDPGRDKWVSGPNSVAVRFVQDELDLAPFAWVDTLNGRYLNLFGQGLCSPASGRYDRALKESMLATWRCAGFTLWDRDRAEALKGMDKTTYLQLGWKWNAESCDWVFRESSFTWKFWTGWWLLQWRVPRDDGFAVNAETPGTHFIRVITRTLRVQSRIRVQDSYLP